MPESLLEGTGSWIEITNTTSETIDLSDLIIYDEGEDFVEFAFYSPSIAPGQYLVLGTNPDPATNGGVPVDVELPGLILDESEDEIILVHTVEIDRVEWGGEDSIPFVLGYSSSVSPGSESSTGNYDPTAWCT